MGKKHYVLTVISAIIAGLIGGAISSHMLGGEAVFAQKKPQADRVPAKEEIVVPSLVRETRVIEANEFRVVDGEGRVRATLGMKDYLPTLTLRDEKERVRVALGLDVYERGELVFYDEKGTKRVEIGFDYTREPALLLKDKEGEKRAELFLLRENPMLSLKAAKGGGIFAYGKDLYLKGPSIILDGGKDGQPSLELCQSEGMERKTRAVLGSTFELKSVIEKRPPSSLVLFSKDGKVIWKAPGEPSESSRYQAIKLSEYTVFILDTQQGHMWMHGHFKDFSVLRYEGKVSIGEKAGENIIYYQRKP